MTSTLSVREVSVRFGGVQALEDVSFDIAPQLITGLIGPNGAGKTTMMRVITGIVRPNHGTVRLREVELTGQPAYLRIRSGLAISQQLVRPFRDITVRDNVALAVGKAWTTQPFRSLFHRSRTKERQRAEELLRLVGILDYAGRKPGELPLGVLKRLEMARALALDPKLLLLDEPLAGLNHGEARVLADTILNLSRQGLPILLIEHNLGEVMRICERVVVLDNGRKLAEGAAADVLADPAVLQAYVGGGADAVL